MSKAASRVAKPSTNGLVRDLRNIFVKRPSAPKTNKNVKGVIKLLTDRFDVVDEKLCDDVLEYLAPTLKRYKGCTIIDVFPGVGLWSSKLHDSLKPKRHILLEPEDKYVKHFLQPLLDKPRSKYRHSPLPGATMAGFEKSYDEIFASHGLLPKPHLEADDPRLRKIDYSVLLTGNVSRRTDVKIQNKTIDNSRHTARSLAWSSLVNGTVHRQGLVRMLLWTPEVDRVALLPSKHEARRGHEALLNLAMSPAIVTEVEPISKYTQSGETVSGSTFRYSGIEKGSAQLALERMRKRGLKIPEGRKTHALLPMSSEGSRTPSNSPATVRFSTPEALEKALQKLQNRWQGMLQAKIFAMPPNKVSLARSRMIKHYFGRLHYTELVDAVAERPTRVSAIARRKWAENAKAAADAANVNSTDDEVNDQFAAKDAEKVHIASTEEGGGDAEKVDDASTEEGKSTAQKEAIPAKKPLIRVSDMKHILLADILLRAINLETHIKFLEESKHDLTSIRTRLLDLENQIHNCKGMEEPNGIFGRDVSRLIEEWLGYFASPPLLHVDRRPYEPLQAKSEDFFPLEPHLCLVDYTPVERDLSVPGIADRNEVVRIGEALIKFLFGLRTQPVTSALDKLAANAAQDLIPMVPAITDPRKGGRLDAKYLKVRQLTEEMLEGLIKAWFEWPFRPPSWETEVSLSQAGVEVGLGEVVDVRGVEDSEDGV